MPGEGRAVVFGLLHAGLAVARSLGRAGVDVSGVALAGREFGLRSRYLTRRHVAEGDGQARDEAVLAWLRALARDGERLVLIPERDENVELVLRRWADVSEVAALPLPDDPEVVVRLRRKDRLAEAAAKAGVPTPRTALVESERAIVDGGFERPFLLKPVEGQGYALAFGRKAVVAERTEDAVAAWRHAKERGFDMIAQDLVPDSADRIFSLFTYVGRDGEPLASVVGRKVRQGPLRFGTSAVFEVRHDERVLELGLRLLRSAGYRGFAHVEFAHDLRDDAFKVIEVNTRLPVWAGIAMNRHLDMARLAYDDLRGLRVEPRGALREPLSWAYLAKDVWVSLQMARDGDLRPREFLGPYVREGKVRAVFAADDPAPAVASLGYLLSRVP